MTETARPALGFRSFEPYYAQLERTLLPDLEMRSP
jgi:hypothetical protein